MRIGVLCPSEIAFRRFMPALQQTDEFEFVGIGVYKKEERFSPDTITDEVFKYYHDIEINKANPYIEQYGGKIYEGYETIISAPEIDALYIPLPPALHYKWAKKALECGKHVLVEKPATISEEQTKELIKLARSKGLAIHENYMFIFHEQLDAIENIINSGEIGDIRSYRICFGFPRRDTSDFRYNKALGGGALIDAGGYTIMYATRLLGPTVEIKYAQSNFIDGFEVDMYGSAAIVNADGVTVQIAFGMDNNYKCELEAWGSKGCLTTGRVLTAPAGFIPSAIIKKGNEVTEVSLPADDAFLKSILFFKKCVDDTKTREMRYNSLQKQAELLEDYKRLAKLDF